MYQIIIIIHVLLGLGIIGLILIQQGKGADAGASFGSGSSGSVFGAQGAGSFLSRTTATLAALFFITSLGLAILNGKQGVAYDLMSSEAVKKDTVAVPEADSSKINEDLPVVPSSGIQGSSLPAPISSMQAPVEPVKAEATPAENAVTSEKIQVKQPLPEDNAPIVADDIKATEVPKVDVIKPTKAIKQNSDKKTQVKPKKDTAKVTKKVVADKKAVEKK